VIRLPDSQTPLYNHPLPEIERWLQAIGCQQNERDIHCWRLLREDWQAELCLDVEELTVRYVRSGANPQEIARSFKYSLTRQDIENAILDGP
jgi:hypothetical protein